VGKLVFVRLLHVPLNLDQANGLVADLAGHLQLQVMAHHMPLHVGLVNSAQN
jgi:hypothetical protein